MAFKRRRSFKRRGRKGRRRGQGKGMTVSRGGLRL